VFEERSSLLPGPLEYDAGGARDRCAKNQCVAVCCSVMQCVAVCCSVLQCVAVLTEYDAGGTRDRCEIISQKPPSYQIHCTQEICS